MRLIRILWAILFILPLGFFADRLCYIDLADPAYHSLLWLHERLPVIFAALAVMSAGAALLRFVRIQGQIRSLESLRSRTPDAIVDAFEVASARVGGPRLTLIYIDVSSVFCFAIFSGRVVISRGFVEQLHDEEELRLVADHETLHVRRADPLKALLWHLFFAAWIVPGFEPLEEAFYAGRERRTDRGSRALNPQRYDALLARFGAQMCNGTPGAGFRFVSTQRNAHVLRGLAPSLVPVSLLALLIASHVLFVQNLPYLQSHHC